MKDTLEIPAFPTHNGLDKHNRPHGGMTLRDYFAGHALTGLVAGGRANDQEELNLGSTGDQLWLAGTAYELADEMLKARQS